MKTVKIDDFGNICENGKYTLHLTGCYEWCCVAKCWVYEVEKTTPEISIKTVYSKTHLL